MKNVMVTALMVFKGGHGMCYRPAYILESRLAMHFGERFAIKFANNWPLQN